MFADAVAHDYRVCLMAIFGKNSSAAKASSGGRRGQVGRNRLVAAWPTQGEDSAPAGFRGTFIRIAERHLTDRIAELGLEPTI